MRQPNRSRGRRGEGRPERRLDEQHGPVDLEALPGRGDARPGPSRALGRGVAAREDPRAWGRRSEGASRRARRRPAPAARRCPGPSRRRRAARGAREPRRAAAGAGGGSSRRSRAARGRLRRRRAAVPDRGPARRSRRAACGSRAAVPDSAGAAMHAATTAGPAGGRRCRDARAVPFPSRASWRGDPHAAGDLEVAGGAKGSYGRPMRIAAMRSEACPSP